MQHVDQRRFQYSVAGDLLLQRKPCSTERKNPNREGIARCCCTRVQCSPMSQNACQFAKVYGLCPLLHPCHRVLQIRGVHKIDHDHAATEIFYQLTPPMTCANLYAHPLPITPLVEPVRLSAENLSLHSALDMSLQTQCLWSAPLHHQKTLTIKRRFSNTPQPQHLKAKPVCTTPQIPYTPRDASLKCRAPWSRGRIAA